MNKQEYLFTQLSSECAEVSHRISKILQFGLHEKQEGQDKTNHKRFWDEFNDLIGALDLLIEEGYIKDLSSAAARRKKKSRVRKYMKYAIKQGTLK